MRTISNLFMHTQKPGKSGKSKNLLVHSPQYQGKTPPITRVNWVNTYPFGDGYKPLISSTPSLLSFTSFPFNCTRSPIASANREITTPIRV